MRVADPSLPESWSTSTGPFGPLNMTGVFGGRTNVTPLWNVCASVHDVCPLGVDPSVPPRASTAAAVGAGIGVPADRLALVFRFQVYAFTSAYPMVLLSPSAKSPVLFPPFVWLE